MTNDDLNIAAADVIGVRVIRHLPEGDPAGTYIIDLKDGALWWWGEGDRTRWSPATLTEDAIKVAETVMAPYDGRVSLFVRPVLGGGWHARIWLHEAEADTLPKAITTAAIAAWAGLQASREHTWRDAAGCAPPVRETR